MFHNIWLKRAVQRGSKEGLLGSQRGVNDDTFTIRSSRLNGDPFGGMINDPRILNKLPSYVQDGADSWSGLPNIVLHEVGGGYGFMKNTTIPYFRSRDSADRSTLAGLHREQV